jgi:hypothetical protein
MPRKRKPAFDPATQTALVLGAPFAEPTDGMLRDIERKFASAIALILTQEERPRIEVAAAMSALVDGTVSRTMLDAYASEARTSHNISAGRFLVLIAATRRYDVLDQLLNIIGVKAVVGPEVLKLELGLLEADLISKRRRGANLRRAIAGAEIEGGVQ